MKRAFYLTVSALVAAVSSGCFAKIDVAADGGGDADASDATTPVDGTTGAGSAVGPACWQGSKDAPAATGPSGTANGCSLVGTWDYEVTFSGPGQRKMVWSFDDEGRAVGGPAGTNLCAAFPWYGNYTLSDTGFAAKNIRGKGAPGCGWASNTTFTVEFSADCQTMTLPRILTDNCTGGALFYVGKMTRKN